MYFGGAESKIPQWPPGAELTRSGSKYKQRDEICVFGGGGYFHHLDVVDDMPHLGGGGELDTDGCGGRWRGSHH
jgi:hypothetical protein